jgi:hypothetical protein
MPATGGGRSGVGGRFGAQKAGPAPSVDGQVTLGSGQAVNENQGNLWE